MSNYIDMKCSICGDEWEYSEKQYELNPFKICTNCSIIGPNEPGIYKIPKGRLVPTFLHDRDSIIVSEDEMRRLYQEYFDQVAEHSNKMKEKYGRK